MPEVVTIGETMLRLAAPPGMALEQAPHYTVLAAGAESNVAVTLARLGTSAGWISRLPDNPLGRRIVREIGAHGVDVSRVIWAADGRVGIYFLEPGAAPRPARVIYDRAQSAFASISPDDVDWPYLGQARLLHLTGITPALSDACRTVAAKAKDQAQKNGKIVSIDVNYRAKLWPEEQARAVLSPLLERAGIIICTKDDGELLLGRTGSAGDMCGMLVERFHAEVALVTDGMQCAAAHNGRVLVKDGFAVESIDRIGAGDAFAGGFIHGFLTEGVERGLDYGLAAAALKHSYYGDVAWISKDDLQKLLSRPQRWR
jgi:2-dehydro-3-deoxygluconokinase